MTPTEFIATRPCLEEIEGYLHRLDFDGEIRDPALRQMTDRIAEMRRSGELPPGGSLSQGGPRQEPLTADGLRVIESWKRKLLKGKALPAPSRLPRRYRYRANQKPLRLRVPE